MFRHGPNFHVSALIRQAIGFLACVALCHGGVYAKGTFMTNEQKLRIIGDIKEQLSKIGENAPADIQELVAEAIGKLSDLERSLMSLI